MLKALFEATPEKAIKKYNQYCQKSKKHQSFYAITHIKGRNKYEWMITYGERKA